MILLVGDGDVAVHGVYGIRHRAYRFPWKDKHYLRVQGVLLISHGDSRTAMLPSYDLNSLTLTMHYLWILIKDRKVGLPGAHIIGLCSNEAQILLSSGANTSTIMALWM